MALAAFMQANTMSVSTSPQLALGLTLTAHFQALYPSHHYSCLLIVQEDREGKKVYHLWFRKDLAVVLFKHLQHQDKLSYEDSLHNYLVYTK